MSYFREHYSNIYFDLSPEREKQALSFFGPNFGEAVRPLDKAQSQCLDLGCGFGNFVYYLRQNGFTRVKGIDSDKEQIDICKLEFTGYQFEQVDVFDFLRKTEQKYRLISCFSLLEHLPKEKIVDFLRLVKERLTLDGFFVLSTPNMETIFGNSGGRYGDFTHTVGFTYFSLLQVLKMAGFGNEYQIEIFGSPKKERPGLLFFVYSLLSKITLFLTRCYFLLLRYQMPKVHSYALCAIIKKR